MGTPWTAHNSSIPAYPNVLTPDPTGRYLVGSPGISPSQVPGAATSPRQALVITGADIAIQPVPQHAVFEQEVQAPAQEGPLTHYPSYSVVDPRHKWQRIRDWASRDSATATGAASAGSSSAGAAGASAPAEPPANPGEIDVSASIDSTLLELELERARASLKAAAAAGGSGGPSSVAAAISAAAAALKAVGGPNPHAIHSAGGALSSGRYGTDLIVATSSLSVGGGGAPRSGVMPREPSFGGFGAGAAAAAPVAAASGGLQAQSSDYRHMPVAAAESAGLGGQQAYPQPGALQHPLRSSVGYAALHHAAAGPVSARADAFQPSVGATADVSALLHQHAMHTPGAVGTGGPAAATAAGRPGVVAAGVGIPGYVHSVQHSQAAFTVERTALEARCRAAEEAMTQAERRHAVETERLQSRVAALESGLAAERQLCGGLQQQLQGELQRHRAATEAEAAARAAEAAAKEMLAASNQSLELERRRAAEVGDKAAEAARSLSSRAASLEAERAGLEKQLLQEKEHGSALHKQLRDAQRQEQSLLEKLGASEAARQQQELRLEAADEHVTAMRNELQLLHAKLAARDKQLLKHVQEVEETQLAALRSELAGAQSRLQRQEGAYAALKSALASVHQALGPQALAAAFGYSEPLLGGFSADAAAYGTVADRLMSGREVREEDAAAVVQRVKELVAQTRGMYMAAEKREVALTAETDEAMSALRQTNTEAESRLASCNAALRTATQRVEEITQHLQESRARCSDLEASLQAAQRDRQAERQRGEELQAAMVQLQGEAGRLRLRVSEVEGAQRELAASREQAAQLQQQVEQLSALAQRSTEAAEIKDERIRELRTALTSALDSSNAAEGQAGALVQEKQLALEALEAERQRSAGLEAVVQATEQQLARVRDRAEAVEASYRELSHQVMVAAREALVQAREVQQGDGALPPQSATSQRAPSPERLSRAASEWAAQLAALEGLLERLSRGTTAATRPSSSSTSLGDFRHDGLSYGRSGVPYIVDQDLPQASTRLLLDCIHQLAAQQHLTAQHLTAAQQHLTSAAQHQQGVSPAAAGPPSTGGRGPGGESGGATSSLPLHDLAQKVAAASEEAVQIARQLAEARQEAARASVLQERLTACEAELERVKATAQAEFGRVQGEVSKAFTEAERIRDDARSEAEARIRAAEQAAADAAVHVQARAAAAEAEAEARLRDAEAARSAAVALVTSLREELANERSMLDAARAELRGMQEEQAAGLRHIAGLNEQLQRQGEEAAHWRNIANPRTRERLLTLAKVRVLRRTRAQLREGLAAEKHRSAQLGRAAETRRERIKRGLVQLRQLQIDNVQLSSRLQEAESRAARADALVSKVEERRITVEQDRKAQVEKAAKLTGQLAEVNKTLEAARRAEAAARRDLDRIVREQLEPQQRRTAAVLEELERAAEALQESQANATRLLQQGEALRTELADTKRAAEVEAQRAQERLAGASRDVTDRDALIASLRQQLAMAQAAAAGTAALLPSLSTGELGDAAAVQAHLISQLGVMQAANADLDARRCSAETELEVLRVRLSRAEAISLALAHGSASITPVTPSGLTPAVHSLSQEVTEPPRETAGAAASGLTPPPPLAGSISASVLRDDVAPGSGRPSFTRDPVGPVLAGAKDQRLQELRAALSSVMAERAALQRELEAAREEGAAEAEAQGAHVRMLEDEVQRLAASLEAAERQLEEVTQSAREAMAAVEAGAAEQVQEAKGRARELVEAVESRLQEEVAALERRAREAERAAAEASTRCEERLRQAERAREQLSQLQALHASAEEAVRQLSAQLRELQAGSIGHAAAAAEAQQLQSTAEGLRGELAVARDAAETAAAEARRLSAQNEATAAQARDLASQLQGLSEDLAAARTRIGVLQQELAEHRAEADILHRANEALRVSLSAAEERHMDSEAQLVEAEAALSRQQGLVRQVQAENDRLHEQYGQLQQQLQQLISERRAAAAVAATAAAIAALSPSISASPRFVSPTRSARPDAAGASGPGSGRAPLTAKRREGSPLGGLGSRLLEEAVQELQTKLNDVKAELAGAEIRASGAEQEAQLLRTDLEAAQARLRLAEAKAAELQNRLEASLSGSAQGVGALKEKLLELELQMDEQLDREQAAQSALTRASERCEELQVALGAAERRAEELQHRCEDRELEVGVLQAQLASASAQRLAQQAEAQQAGATHGSFDQTVTSALELAFREKALMADALQADSQAALARAEAAERELSEQRTLVEALRSEAQELEHQRESAALEAQLSADAAARLRAECSKLTEKLATSQKELLETQEARDRTAAQLRAAEARLAEERSDVESLRRQLEVVGSQGRGADTVWSRRVADLEAALAAARKQAADAEDAVVEAAAAQVRSAGLEVRAQDLEAALAEAETRAAAATDAEARAASALAAHREANRQEVTGLQLQVQGLQDKLAVCERQVADRDARLEGLGAQLMALRSHTEAFEGQLREVKQELRAALKENESLMRKVASLDQDAAEAVRRGTQHADSGSVSGVSMSTTSHAPQQQLVGMLSENRDLLEKLTSTHLKLKQARSKLAQWEQELKSKDLEVERLHAQVMAAQGSAADRAAMVTSSPNNAGAIIAALKSELQAYKAALAASQEEAAASAAAAAEAQARCEALTQRLQQDGERRASHSQASTRVVEHASPSMLERLQQDGSGADDETRNTLQALSHKVRAQRSEIDTLASELQTSNAKRGELAKEAAMLDQRLAKSEIRERDLVSNVETLQQQLELAQQQLENRQIMLQQLTSVTQQQPQGRQKHIVGLLGPPPSPLSTEQPGWEQGPAADGMRSLSASPRSQATRLYHATLSLSPTRSAAAADAAAVAGLQPPGRGGSLAASYSSEHQLLLAQQHQQQATKLDRVVALWRDACRAKDTRVQDLQADLATFSSQLGRARADASALAAKVLEREQALTSCQHQFDLTRDRLEAQLRAADDKLEVKAQRLTTVEEELLGREEELRNVRMQLQAAERTLMVLQGDSGAQREAAARMAADLAAANRQVAILQAEVQELQQRGTAARSGAQQMTDQVAQLQEQLTRADSVVGRLVFAVRSALSAALKAAGGVPHLRGLEGSSGGGAKSGNLPTSLRLLEELTTVLAEELQRRSAALATAEAELTGVQGRLSGREEDVKRLEARLTSTQDSLAARLDEVSRLQTALRRKEIDCEAVETEISAQIADYQRLKQRLLQQERDSSRLSADQETLLRRSDELEAALAAKQEECALLLKKCSQLEEQWQAGRSAMAALQERVRALDAQSESLQRNSQTATLAKQDAAAALEAARIELRGAAQQAATYREQLEQRNNEIRELNSMLQAWEAMRLGKDAQIAALLERCKRHEEDAAEKARTIEALRRKLQVPGGPVGPTSISGVLAPGAAAVSPASSAATPITMPQLQQQQGRPVSSGNSGGTRHIHVHMHTPVLVASPAVSGVSGAGSNVGR